MYARGDKNVKKSDPSMQGNGFWKENHCLSLRYATLCFVSFRFMV